MLNRCVSCPDDCKIDRKGAAKPRFCPYTGAPIDTKRVVDLVSPIVEIRTEVVYHDKYEVPTGWTLFQCLEHMEIVYKVKHVPANISESRWRAIVDNLHKDKNYSLIRWINIHDLF